MKKDILRSKSDHTQRGINQNKRRAKRNQK